MSSTISALFVGSIVLVLASNISLASATPVASISEILLPTPNITGGPAGEIQCYALPYGALGLISHLLTYWTIACVSWGRIPIWPKRRIKECNYDMFLAVLALCTCIPIASITVNRCRLSWHFVLICIWKLLTSVSLACITIHRCIVIRREKLQSGTADAGRDVNTQSGPEDVEMTADSQEHPHDTSKHNRLLHAKVNLTPLWWLLLYLAGTIVGMVGLCSLLYTTFRQDETIRSLTYGFGGALAIIPILVAIYWFQRSLSDDKKGGRKAFLSAFGNTFGGAFFGFIAVFGFFSSLYSDLVLGTIANNITGLPSQDFAPIYWAWFVAKRLPLLSF
jgi:hypothetical protein